jgi:hypothetical protein
MEDEWRKRTWGLVKDAENGMSAIAKVPVLSPIEHGKEIFLNDVP